MTQKSRSTLENVAMASLVGLVAIALGGSGCASFRAAQLYRSGTAELNRGQVERAVVDLSAAVELARDASEIHNHLGLALAGIGDHGGALAEFERAVELDCRNAAAAENLDVARRNEDQRRAIAILSKTGDLRDE